MLRVKMKNADGDTINILRFQSRTAFNNWLREHIDHFTLLEVESTKTTTLDTITDLKDIINRLQAALDDYSHLSVDEQKTVRHKLYQQKGDYAKALTSMFPQFLEAIKRHG